MDRNELGRAGEDVAAEFLGTQGYRIVDRNVRLPGGEIDLVAARGDVLVFIEVKTRRSRAFGTPAEAVTPRKAARIRGLAVRYLAARTTHAPCVRFDVIDVLQGAQGFAVLHLEDAF